MTGRARVAAACPPGALAVATSVALLAYDPLASAASPKRALALLVALALLGASIVRGGRVRSVSPAAMLFLAFVAWSGATLVYGVPSGARDLGTWVGAAGVALAVQGWAPSRMRRAATWTAMLTGAGASVWVIAEALRGARGAFLHGGQGNANWLGLLVAVTLPLGLGALRVRRRARLVGALVLVVQAAGLALSHSRVGWAAGVVAVGIVAAARVSRDRLASRWILGGLAVATLAGAVALRAAPAIDGAHPAGADVPIPLAWKGRTWIRQSSADAAHRALPFGVGLGGFAHAYLDAQGERLRASPPREASRAFVNATTAHSDWLEVLVDSGPVAWLLLALSIGAGVVGARRWPEGAAALVAFAVCAAGDSPLRQPAVAVLVALVLAACPRAWTLPASSPRLASVMRWGALAACAVLFTTASRGWLAERRLTRARDATPTEAQALLASALRLDPSSGEIALELGLAELAAGDAERAGPELERSRQLLANVGSDLAIGNARMMVDDPVGALSAYERVLARSPGSFRAHANVSRPLVALGRLDEAEGHLALAAELWPGHPLLLDMMDDVRRARVARGATSPDARR